MNIRLLIIFSLFLSVQISYSKELTVPSMFSDIQEGINAARYGDIVTVAAGIYKEHIKIPDGVTLRGAGINNSTLEGSTNIPVVVMEGRSKISGFTVTHSSEFPGYGIYCFSAQPFIENTRITKTKWGIGAYLGSPRINDNTIEGNYTEGIHCVASNPTITGNTISKNGDGIFLSFCFSTLLQKNEIKQNKIMGIYCLQSSPSIIQNSITGNKYANILCNVNSYPTIHANGIYDGGFYNVELYSNKMQIDARKNYWGSSTKEKILEKIWDGSDTRGLGSVKISPWYTTETAALTAPGDEIKMITATYNKDFVSPKN